MVSPAESEPVGCRGVGNSKVNDGTSAQRLHVDGRTGDDRSGRIGVCEGTDEMRSDVFGPPKRKWVSPVDNKTKKLTRPKSPLDGNPRVGSTAE